MLITAALVHLGGETKGYGLNEHYVESKTASGGRVI